MTISLTTFMLPVFVIGGLFLMIWCTRTVDVGTESNNYFGINYLRKKDPSRRPYLIVAGLCWFFSALIVWNWSDTTGAVNWLPFLRLIFMTLAIITFLMMGSFTDKEPFEWKDPYADEDEIDTEAKRETLSNRTSGRRALGMGSRINAQMLARRQYAEYRRRHPDYGNEGEN